MNNKILRLLVGFILLFSLSCNFAANFLPGGSTSGTGEPLVAKGSGPAGLTAEATSADSVSLSWQAVEGATSYHLAVSICGEKTLALADLGASITTYKDYIALPGSQVTYAVEALSDSGSIGQSIVNVTTPPRQPNPLTVEAQLDKKKSAKAVLDTQGGSVSVTDAKGTEYKLVIPAGALIGRTEITLTTVKEIGGWPLDGAMLGGVYIEPEGLHLLDAATLTITLPGARPNDKLSTLGYAFSGSGQEFHLQPAYVKNAGTGFVPGSSGGGHLANRVQASPQEIVLETLEMYGVGVGQGSADSAGELVNNNSPTDAGAAMDQKQAAAGAEQDDLAPLPPTKDPAATISAAALHGLIYAAHDCGSLRTALVAFQKWRGSYEYNNSKAPDQIQASDKAIMDGLADKVKEVIDTASEECTKSNGKGPVATAQAGCLETIIDLIAQPPHTGSGFYSDLQSVMLSKFGGRVVADADDNFAKCLPSYSASGGSNGYAMSGEICSLRSAFTLKANGMEAFDVLFTPSSALSGQVVAGGGGGGCSDGGGGSYIVNLKGDGGGNIIAIFPASTIVCPGVSKTNQVVQSFDITPLENKSSTCK
jgi:hypothetical protein